MTTETVVMAGAPVHLVHLGEAEGPHLIWAHGWGHSGAAMAPLAESARRWGRSTLVDFPGFGLSPPPPATWSTADYADAVAGWLATLPPGRRVWIGHSFGTRVGLQLAARHPGLIDALCLISAAGLQRRRTPWQRLQMWLKVRAFKALKAVVPEGPARERLRARFGSADYANAGPMRAVFLETIREDLTEVARRVAVPTLLVYGSADVDTPPEIGERFNALIAGSKLVLLERQDHFTVLGSARPQTLFQIQTFLKGLGWLS